MEFRRLISAKDALFPEAFALYEISFPQHEQRTLGKQTALMGNPLYHFDVVIKEGAFAGILLYWDLTGYTYIEHFAINPLLRGQSVGTNCLSAFCVKYAPVILEIDPPVNEVSMRRQGFYERLGFQTNGFHHLHPGYHPGRLPHELVVMSYHNRLSEEAFRLFSKELRDIVMQDVRE